MLRLLDPKTRIFFPGEEKNARFQAPLSSPAERNRARSAFKRFFPPKSLRKIEVQISLGQSLRVFNALSLIYSTSCYHGFGDPSFRRVRGNKFEDGSAFFLAFISISFFI